MTLINTANLTEISAAPMLVNRFDSDDEDVHDDDNLLPIYCGSSFGNRVFGGEIADLGEFPW